jgi:hypothetical protein
MIATVHADSIGQYFVLDANQRNGVDKRWFALINHGRKQGFEFLSGVCHGLFPFY